MNLPPLPPSAAEVSDLILSTREHVQALGWLNRECLYPESHVRAYAAAAVAAERERCAAQLDALGCDHCAGALRNWPSAPAPLKDKP